MVRVAPDPVTTAHCEGCGQTFTTPQRGPARGPIRYCSILCREYVEHGDQPWACEIPARHPARGYHPPQPKPQHPRRTIPCAWCGTPVDQTRHTERFCSRRCHEHHAKRARRGRRAGAGGTYGRADIERLWEAFGRRCAYCRNDLPSDELHAEHVIPLSRGGANGIENLLPSCLLCNGDKRDLSLADWAADRSRRGLPAVHTDWRPDDPLYRHLCLTGTA